MLCKKHQIEECNSSDCESCNLEIRIKQLEKDNRRLGIVYDRAMDLIKEYNKKEVQKALEDKDDS